jgi:hypothetical protein
MQTPRLIRWPLAPATAVLVALVVASPACPQEAFQDNAAVFDATFVGISPGQFWSYFRELLVPALAFTFLFFYNLPLKEIPFVKDLADYEPPVWVLPLFALGILFLSAFIGGTAFFLSFWTDEINGPLFQQRFQKSSSI